MMIVLRPPFLYTVKDNFDSNMPNKHAAFSLNLRHRLGWALLCASLVIMAGFLPPSAQAQNATQQNITQTAQAAGVDQSSTDLVTIIGRIINIALGFIGTVFLMLMLYAGYLWMTAGGDPEKVKKAQMTIRNSIIGIVIIASAWAITSFILGLFAGQGEGVIGGGTTQPLAPFTTSPGAACLGKGPIDMQLPERNATNVPRNSPIIVTFKQPIKPESMMSDWTNDASTTKAEWRLNDKNIIIYKTKEGATTALNGDAVKVRYTKDLKTWVFKPVDYLGNQVSPTNYTVILMGGKTGIMFQNNTPAITCSPTNQYAWQFEVSTVVDLVPPTVTSVIPPPDGIYFRNIVVQINFSKAIDPTAAQGKTADGFSNIETLAAPQGSTNFAPVNGEYRVTNQYKTVEFMTDFRCGTNSCGRDIYCLPGNSAITVTAKAAKLDGPGPQAVFTSNGYDGVVSVVGNSLDGNVMGGDGKAEGPPVDNFSFGFSTNNDIKLAPPVITLTVPDANPQLGETSNVPFDQPVVAVFDSFLQSSTLNTDNVTMDAHGVTEKPDSFWWMVGMKMVKKDGSDVNDKAQPPEKPETSAINIMHRAYLPSGTYPNLNYYDPYITSEVQDAYQNCFNPARKCGAGTGFNCCKYTPGTDECVKILHP
jgi:hypothetical protein